VQIKKSEVALIPNRMALSYNRTKNKICRERKNTTVTHTHNLKSGEDVELIPKYPGISRIEPARDRIRVIDWVAIQTQIGEAAKSGERSPKEASLSEKRRRDRLRWQMLGMFFIQIRIFPFFPLLT
jgi:hypothetical protein